MMIDPNAAASTNPSEAPAATAPDAAAPPEAPPPAPTKPADFTKADYLVLFLMLVLSFFVASFEATNSDVRLHLAIGQRLSEGTFTFGVDPFSWATHVEPAPYWVHHSWLYSWLFYQLFHLIGGPGLVMGKAILFTTAIVLLSRIGWNEANRWFIVLCLTMAVLATSPRLLLQPTVVSLLFLAITMHVIWRAGVLSLSNAEGRPTCARWLWALPPLFALWANLDVWFILGPLVVGVCWAASGLARWYKGATPVPGKRLGLVFGVGLAACLLNPFHVRVFQLPAELAYIAISVTEPLKISLPDELVAGGRTLKELRNTGLVGDWTSSSVEQAYFRTARGGYSIARLAFYPYIVLGLFAFTLAALTRPQAGAPTLQVTRFLLWLVFGVFSVALARLIPFFALVAAPLTAMTLGEFVRWQQVSSEVASTRQGRGLDLARFISIPFLLVLLYLAWPGWLQGNQEFSSPWRVAWKIREDPSLRRSAETLESLKRSGHGGNVFNVSFDTAHYCANFAPDVKYFFDTRFALYAGVAGKFKEIRRDLLDQKEAWRPLFAEHHVDQVALASFTANLNREPAYMGWLTNTAQWRLRVADDRVMIFSLAPPGRPWPAGTAQADWDQEAFGLVPAERRPPLDGTLPPVLPSVWSLYADGVGATPTEVPAIRLMLFHYSAANQNVTKMADLTSAIFSYTTIPALQALPGSGMADVAMLLRRWQMVPTRPNDFGPPALPILMLRAARRAVHENPLDIPSRLVLLDSNHILRTDQEDYWTHYTPGRSNPPSPLRELMRSTQRVTDLMILTQLPGLAPNLAYKEHENLAKLFRQRNFVDLALDQKAEAHKALLDWKASGKEAPKELDAFIKQNKQQLEDQESNVRQRLARWKSISDGKPPLAQAALAIQGAYVEVVGDKQRTTPLGLAKKAIEILTEMKESDLKDEELYQRDRTLLDLVVAIGDPAGIRKMAERLADEKFRKSLGPATAAQYQIAVGGAIGDCAMIDEGAAGIEKMLRAEITEHHKAMAVEIVVGALRRPETMQLSAINLQTALRIALLQERQNEMCSAMTLRGIAALEAGDTSKARRIFQAIFDEVGSLRFSERPIAARYLELLNQQQGK